MLHHPTHDKLTRLKLFGMARAFAEQSALDLDHLTFEERLGLLVDHEVTERDGKALALRLQRAKLKPNTAAEDTDYRHPRGLDKALFQRLLAGQWLTDRQNVLLTGPTGVGKTWLACALAHQACRQGYSAYYVRLPRLLDELGIGRADGRYGKLLKQLARIDTLVIDDWGLAVLDDAHRRDLLEVLDDRHGTRSTIVTSQLPIEHWHAAIGDPTLADAILDRLVHNAHQLNLKGDSLRRKRAGLTSPAHQEKNRTSTPCRHAPSVQFGLEQVSSLHWNACPVCGGTGVQFRRNTQPAVKNEGKLSSTSSKAIYSATKSVLTQVCRMGRLNASIFPPNPFPSVERAYKGQEPLNKREMERVMAGLAKDLQKIREGRFDGQFEDQLAVYFLLISARSGRNLTPLLEMTVDCIQPHPLREDMCILQVYKRRGYKKSVMAFQTDTTEDTSSSVPTDVDQLAKEVIAMNEDLRKSAPADLRDFMWLTSGSAPAKVGLLKPAVLTRCIANFVLRHNLTADQAQWDGFLRPMTLNVSRLRKTFGQRIWELSEGNLLRTANLLGNLPRITNSHYLAVTPEMEKNHKFVGTILHATFEGNSDTSEFKEKLASQMNVSLDRVETILSGQANTGVGRCSDFLFGRFSPRNGEEVCTRFLHCFRCPNQVVMESDLHRLFSFYWLLLKERAILGRTRWKKVYGWVIREIDTSIAGSFHHAVVARAKERARTDPHPMWKDRGMLGVGIQ